MGIHERGTEGLRSDFKSMHSEKEKTRVAVEVMTGTKWM